MSDLVTKITDTVVKIDTTQVISQVASLDELKKSRDNFSEQLVIAQNSYQKRIDEIQSAIDRIDKIISDAKSLGVS